MSSDDLRLRRLQSTDVVDSFDCGNATLNDWLSRAALTADRKDTARVLVWADEQRRVLAYVAIAPAQIERSSLPRRLGHGSPDAIPTVLLAKLALDVRLQGQGAGQMLLLDALAVVTDAVNRVGGRYIVVDAIDDAAAAFCRRHGFLDSYDPRRLLLRTTDAVASFTDSA